MFCFCKNQRLQPEKEDDGRKRSGSITATSATEKGGRDELRTERGKESFKTQKVSEKTEAQVNRNMTNKIGSVQKKERRIKSAVERRGRGRQRRGEDRGSDESKK